LPNRKEKRQARGRAAVPGHGRRRQSGSGARRQLDDTPDFPAQWQASALGARDALNMMREEKPLDWTMLSASAYIHPGERTGTFRLGDDRLLVGAEGKSEISTQDYAVAMLD
jgi:putative NADH-flavin reductase